VSFFIFIFLLLCIIFVILQNGLFLDELAFENVKIEQLYIKWNEKLDISLKEIHISKSKAEVKSEFDYKDIHHYFTSLSQTKEWFHSIVIDKISYEDMNASFHYTYGEDGILQLHAEDVDFNGSLSLSENSIVANIKHFENKERKIEANGKLYFNTKELKVYTKVAINIAKDAKFILYSSIGENKLFYKVNSLKKITHLKNLIAIANLPKAVRYWAYDAIKMSHVTLDKLTGYLEYDDMKNAYKNITLKATVYDLNYTYNKELDQIHSKRTELKFSKGIFYIYPKEAYSYGMYLDKSWIKIDFTKKEELLSINLLFNGMLNKDVLHILKAYKINLPFLQRSGSVKTDLTITVGLRSVKVGAKGLFYTKKANFDYLDLNIDIADATIKLDNYDVSIKNMRAQYGKIAKAHVDVIFDAKKGQGSIDFLFSSIHIAGATLQTLHQPLHASYTISPKGDMISADKSIWHYKKQIIRVDTLVLPFDTKTLDITIPTTFVTLHNVGNGFVSGKVNAKTLHTELDVDILKFSYDGVEFSQSNTPVHVEYKDTIKISSKDVIYFNVAGSPYKADRLFIEIKENYIYLKHTLLSIGKYITTKIYMKINTETKRAHVSLTNFILKDPNTNKILYKSGKILLSALFLDDKIKVLSKELDGEFVSQDTGWRLKINDLGRVAKDSVFLKKLSLTSGEFTLYKNKKDKYTRFISKIDYPFKILVQNNKPVEKYKVTGKIYKETVFVDINDRVHLTVKEDINVKMKNCVVNLFEGLDAIKEMKDDSNTTQESMLDIKVHAKESSLYVDEKRSILYDKLDLQFVNNILTAQMNHAKGSAGLKLENNEFHLYGKDFNDKFMNKLFSLSKFSKGRLDFSVNGLIDDYSGVMYINQSTIKDYKLLNNILAFVNTVPSLVTFNLPGYNKKGLFVESAYVTFDSKDEKFTIKDIYLDSKEMDIIGHGVVDMKKNSLDIVLNLKTDLGSNLSKVPVVGYILLDGDTISTTLSITGKLEDPKVESLLATDIAVAPLNIIKRMLLLPYKLFEDITGDSNTTE